MHKWYVNVLQYHAIDFTAICVQNVNYYIVFIFMIKHNIDRRLLLLL